MTKDTFRVHIKASLIKKNHANWYAVICISTTVGFTHPIDLTNGMWHLRGYGTL